MQGFWPTYFNILKLLNAVFSRIDKPRLFSRRRRYFPGICDVGRDSGNDCFCVDAWRFNRRHHDHDLFAGALLPKQKRAARPTGRVRAERSVRAAHEGSDVAVAAVWPVIADQVFSL